ncbi:MAG: hypothetical protein KUG77_09210 [Nannocystaceae bacterium]|nr:hypothetical protein [Nannocystaceae bacterium]
MSPRHDFTWFVLPGVLAAIAGLTIGLLPASSETREGGGLELWILGVLLVDVAHVYASLYRTYLDPQARARHAKRLWVIPALCLWVGMLLHLESPLLFWSVLAYVAIFHFIKQHLGFALIYLRAGGEDRVDRRLVTAAIWAGTLGPVLHWHAHLPTRFTWFVQGDLIAGAPAWLGTIALWGQVPIWVAFLARRIQRWRTDRANPVLFALVVLPAINWHLGMVIFDDDRVFTITNVFFHGVPYFALVWVAGGRAQIATRLKNAGPALLVLVFYGVLLALAVTEEALWDRLIWHDRPELFGDNGTTLSPFATAFAVSLLTLPQATHYVLDRFIWRVGPDNPKLAGQLGLVTPQDPAQHPAP